MAKNNNNIIINGISGHIGKQVVVKQYSFGTVVTKYPDMSNVIHTQKQIKEKGRFARAVAFAQSIIKNPEQKMEWQQKIPKDKKVYHAAIQWFLENEDLASSQLVVGN
jgi:hypothetical protein